MNDIPFFYHKQLEPSIKILESESQILTLLRDKFKLSEWKRTENKGNIFITPKGGWFCDYHNRHHDNKAIVIT